MIKPITLVCGFGRCGSSLAMQMLVAGGMPAFGPGAEYPAYETHLSQELPQNHHWLNQAHGYCVKILDPHIFKPANGLPYRVIWIDRNPTEQGKSAVKFIQALVPQLAMTPGAAKKFAKSYDRDRPKVFHLLARLTPAVLRISFEDILMDPPGISEKIIQFLELKLDKAAMVAQVRDRKPECLPYLLEERLLKEWPQQALH